MLVCVGTQCVPSVATRVVAKIYRPFFFVINVYHNDYGVGWLSVTGKCRGLYILHHGKLTAVGGRFLCARHLENVVFDLGGLPLRP